MAETLLNALVEQLQQLEKLPLTELSARRQRRIESIGSFREV
jgi:acetyl-CoA carboxylase alpha subunit